MNRPYLERTVLDGAGADKGHDHGHHVNGELKLQELGDGIVHVPAPHHCLHYAREVVVGEYDIGGLLGHVRAGDAHGKPDVGLLESRRVVGSVPGDRHHLPGHGDVGVDDALYERVLVDRLGSSQHTQSWPDLVQQVLTYLKNNI